MLSGQGGRPGDSREGRQLETLRDQPSLLRKPLQRWPAPFSTSAHRPQGLRNSSPRPARPLPDPRDPSPARETPPRARETPPRARETPPRARETPPRACETPGPSRLHPGAGVLQEYLSNAWG